MSRYVVDISYMIITFESDLNTSVGGAGGEGAGRYTEMAPWVSSTVTWRYVDSYVDNYIDI